MTKCRFNWNLKWGAIDVIRHSTPLKSFNKHCLPWTLIECFHGSMGWHLYFLFSLQVQADNWCFLHKYQYYGLNRHKDCIMLFNYLFHKLIKLSQLFLSIGDCLAFLRHYNEASFIFVQELFTAFLRRILSKLLWVCRNWESKQGLTMQTWMLNIKPKFIKDGQQIKSRLSKYFTWT